MSAHSFKRFFRIFPVALFLLPLFLAATPAQGQPPRLSKGQTLYVPAYSHIYGGNREDTILLTITVSVRNTDPGHPIQVESVDYHDSDGRVLKKFLPKPKPLGAMATTRFVIPEADKSGGSGANFIVKWSALQPVSPPIAETVMISTRTQLGISFTSRGQVIQERP